MSRFWMIECRGTGLVEPDEDDIAAMREQENIDGWGVASRG